MPKFGIIESIYSQHRPFWVFFSQLKREIFFYFTAKKLKAFNIFFQSSKIEVFSIIVCFFHCDSITEIKKKHEKAFVGDEKRAVLIAFFCYQFLSVGRINK